jgi:ATP-binding protein involved in chromosome partitioning
MQVEPSAVLDALKVVRDPDLNRDIVSLGFIKDLKIDAGRVAFTIELTTPACPVKDQMRDQSRAAVLQVPGVTAVEVQMSARVREAVSAEGTRQQVPGVKNIIAVGARRPSRSTWRSRSRSAAARSASSTPISTAPMSRSCWA